MAPWTEPAETATDELVTLLTTARDAGTFDDQLAAIGTADSNLDIVRADCLIAKRYVPVSKLENLDDSLYVSLLPSPEGDEEGSGRGTTMKTFGVDLLIELSLPAYDSAAIAVLIGFGRQLSRLISHNATKRRRLTGIDSLWKSTDVVAKFDPAALYDATVFVHLRRFTFDLSEVIA